jgi:hypothetical protein
MILQLSAETNRIQAMDISEDWELAANHAFIFYINMSLLQCAFIVSRFYE